VTLLKFKQKIKIGLIFVLVVFYGLSFFALGKYSFQKDVLKVKGAKAQTIDREKVDNPVPAQDVQSAKILSQSVRLCSNTTKGFELSYPSSWFTTYNEEEKRCQYFAPYSFVIPESSTQDFAPIQLEALTLEDWEPTLKFFENPNEFYNVLSSQTVEIDSKLVKKIETVTTGAGIIPKGYSQIIYLVFNSKNPIQIRYQQLDDQNNLEEIRGILNEMARSVNFL